MVEHKIYINGLSVLAPGLFDPQTSEQVLSGQQPWQDEPLPKLQPNMLPANERRRTTPLIKIALQALQPLILENEKLSGLSTVFASSDGDLGIVHNICQALAMQEKMVSPTQFHNSVHNAPAGYWAIASGMQGPSVSLSAADGTFAAGLVEAITQVITEQREVLLVAYDVVAPEPLDATRHFDYSFAVALRLGKDKSAAHIGHLSMDIVNGRSLSQLANASLQPLQAGNPIATSLPLLEALTKKATSNVVLPYLMDQQLAIEVNG